MLFMHAQATGTSAEVVPNKQVVVHWMCVCREAPDMTHDFGSPLTTPSPPLSLLRSA